MARDHDRQQDRERLVRRWQRAQRHLLSRDEEQRRKLAARAARAARKRRPRDRGWREQDEPESFAAMHPRTPLPPVTRTTAADAPRGTVTAVHRNTIEVDGRPARLGGDLLLDPAARPVVGDVVALAATDGPPRVLAVEPRRTQLARPDPGAPGRLLVLAANVDVAVIVVAARDPAPKPGLIDRALVALHQSGVGPVVCVNKVDLLGDEGRDELAAMLLPYRELGVPVHGCSASTGEGLAALRAVLHGRAAVFLGHSGVGKSSLLNALDPGSARRVGAVRAGDGKGRHTTTTASLCRFGDGGTAIDTPGVRAFGLARPSADDLRAAFAEFEPFATGCRFADCTHVGEPQCGVRDAAAAGRLPAARYASYLRIVRSDD